MLRIPGRSRYADRRIDNGSLGVFTAVNEIGRCNNSFCVISGGLVARNSLEIGYTEDDSVDRAIMINEVSSAFTSILNG